MGTANADVPAELVQQVLEANPELRAIEAQIDAVKRAVPQAGVWKDPVVAVEYSNMPVLAPWPGNHPMSGLQLKAQQTFPFPGKTEARQAIAQARVRVGKQELAEKRNQLVGLVKDLYYRLALTRQLRAVTGAHVDLVEQFIDVIRVKYEVGRAGQQDMLRLELLRDKLRDDLDDFGLQEQRLLATLNAALHRDPGTAVETSEFTEPPQDMKTLEHWLERAQTGRPLLRVMAARREAELKGALRAQRETLPDLTAWAGYRVRLAAGADPGANFVTAGLSMPLPWVWNGERWGEKAAEHRAQARAQDEKQRAALDRIRGELEAALALWRRSLRKLERYKTKLVPDAHRTLDATLAAYQVDRADFAALYQAELQLLSFERTLHTARNEAAMAAARIETLAGVEAARWGAEQEQQ